MSQWIAGKKVEEWVQKYPLLVPIMKTEEVLWTNEKFENIGQEDRLTLTDINEAELRLQRFASYLAVAFPETKETGGIIESPLKPIEKMKQAMEEQYQLQIDGSLWLKCDSHLPISGSIKARGGIYEVLKHAETLAIQHGLLTETDDYAILATDRFKKFFSRYAIAVGSTGNLGLSIGIISAKLGFKVTVHMSADAKAWKKELLRSIGAMVIEYEADYSVAVAAGRAEAEQDPNCHFIDDENSQALFLGYAVAAKRLQRQLEDVGILVDQEHPLFVYLPCGVGGGPGGVAFGLKLIFGNHVHCFFAEPTHSPCMLLGLMTGLHDAISVQDFGIDNITAADGLAVGRASRFVGKVMESMLNGCFTVTDDQLYILLSRLADEEGIKIEPSAVAGLYGLRQLFGSDAGRKYLMDHQLQQHMSQATHIAWATGGSMVPRTEMEQYIMRGHSLLNSQK